MTASVNPSRLVCVLCAESELPLGYGNATLQANAFSYRATGLWPGKSYAARLTASNGRGFGFANVSSLITLPLQVTATEGRSSVVLSLL